MDDFSRRWLISLDGIVVYLYMSVAKNGAVAVSIANQTKNKAEPKTFYDRDTMP